MVDIVLQLGDTEDNSELPAEEFDTIGESLERSLSSESILPRLGVLINSLVAGGQARDTVLLGQLTLGEINQADLDDLPLPTLCTIEHRLRSLLATLRNQEQPDTRVLAAELRRDWGEHNVETLASHLALEGRSEESLLLLLIAYAAHAGQRRLELDPPVIEALLEALQYWSPETRPFELLNLTAPRLIELVRPADALTVARLCLALLVADYTGPWRLPPGCLWALSQTWPIPRMPGWSLLWERLLREEPNQKVTTSTVPDDDTLLQAHKRAADMVAWDSGSFVRLRSLTMVLHPAVFCKQYMRELQARFEALQQTESWLKYRGFDVRRIIEDLERKIRSWTDEIADQELTDSYRVALAEAGMDDSNPFAFRTPLHVLQDCANSVVEYGQALLQYGVARMENASIPTRNELQEELESLPGLEHLGEAALNQLARTAEDMPPERNESAAEQLLIDHLLDRVLGSPACAERIPHVVGYLTANPFEFPTLLKPLLTDLTAPPVDPPNAVALLLEQEAPNQALSLADKVPLELQKQARILMQQKESEAAELQMALIKIGGAVEDLAAARSLGRWRLVRQEFARRLAARRAERAAASQLTQDRSHEMLEENKALTFATFDIKDLMPVEVYDLLQEGLSLACRAISRPNLQPEVQAYHDEIRTRLEREAWPLDELRNGVQHMKDLVEGRQASSPKELPAEQVLELLEHGELRRLGLSRDELSDVAVETRCDLLTGWLTLRSIHAFESEELKPQERRAIRGLFHYFAMMTEMNQVYDPRDRPIGEEFPVVFSKWRLRYPKAAVLNRSCVLIALPGRPLRPLHMRQFEDYIAAKGFLSDEFVIVLAPGCTPQLRKRLEDSHRGGGLVVVDEQNLIDMILAEAEPGRTPLSRLRPLMIKASNAEHVGVFSVNQLVTAWTGIFVGREEIIDRIAASGENYAVYGGRRIGKSSVLQALALRMQKNDNDKVVYHSFEGDPDCSNSGSVLRLARLLNLSKTVQNIGSLKPALQAYLDGTTGVNIVLLLDEIDKYIEWNRRTRDKHVLIEVLRSLSERYGRRFRVVVAGFMGLYDSMHGRNPYQPASDPWQRMFNPCPLENVGVVDAERIVREGFFDILGWELENRAIPLWIVEHTGGHPAFVQKFCLKIQERVAWRGDHLVHLSDAEAVFADRDPEGSFIAFVNKTLEMNLDPVGRYLILWLAKESKEARGFTLAELREYAGVCGTPIADKTLSRSLEHLAVNSVIRERAPGVFEFTIPDYPRILDQLGETSHLDRLEQEIRSLPEDKP